MKITFKDICGQIAAKNLYESGVTIKDIAKQAKKPEGTIRKWLRNFPQYSTMEKLPNSFLTFFEIEI